MPAPYTRIACFIEGGPASELALAEAVSLQAMNPGCELHMCHVVARPLAVLAGPFGYVPPPPENADEARTWLDERVADIPGAVPVLLDGEPAEAACEYAAEAGVDLIVAAAHRGLVERAMLGGFAAYVAYHAPCPVLLVHPHSEKEQHRRFWPHG